LEAAPTPNYPVKATTPEHIGNWYEFWTAKAGDKNVRKSMNVIVSISITKTNLEGALGIQTNAKLKCTIKSY
jgi:hypothetical protein